ncbi:MAG: ornithine carbamoyltransferase [Puniceicoccaceae bacterium]|nr:MAG: ornithine carbamoyltransferase [Puniceicoccaceae bacterium]
MQHLLAETDFSPAQLPELFALAATFKKNRGGHVPPVLSGQTWALIFTKSSTRTRVSFEVGIRELGGHALFLSKNDIQLGRGESIADTARVLSRYLHGLIVRTFDHADVETLAREGSIPVINALTDFLHPCQIFADAFSLSERWAGTDGDPLAALRGRTVAFFGDCACNVANSWILGAGLLGMKLRLAGPEAFAPGPEIAELAARAASLGGGSFSFTTDPEAAAEGADVLYTDVWVSMGREEESAERIEQMRPYAVTGSLMARTKPDALFMHCLPAYPGKEVEASVLAGPQSIVFDQAENRLHMQKAILAVLGQGGLRRGRG